jgi:RNA polymerase sigma factor (TIGR02999 family)
MTTVHGTGQGASDGDDVLMALRSGHRETLERLVPLVYDELREVASRQLSRVAVARDGDATLATTALVNEAYLKLVDQSQATWNDRAHFLSLAAIAMRHILIDRAKARAALKRGGGARAETLEDDAMADERSPERLLEIDDALMRLAQLEPRLARVVECRFYGGMSEDEIAAALSVTVRTVQRDWAKARALLRHSLS